MFFYEETLRDDVSPEQEAQTIKFASASDGHQGSESITAQLNMGNVGSLSTMQLKNFYNGKVQTQSSRFIEAQGRQ